MFFHRLILSCGRPRFRRLGGLRRDQRSRDRNREARDFAHEIGESNDQNLWMSLGEVA
jgi:hypothetical protein